MPSLGRLKQEDPECEDYIATKYIYIYSVLYSLDLVSLQVGREGGGQRERERERRGKGEEGRGKGKGRGREAER